MKPKFDGSIEKLIHIIDNCVYISNTVSADGYASVSGTLHGTAKEVLTWGTKDGINLSLDQIQDMHTTIYKQETHIRFGPGTRPWPGPALGPGLWLCFCSFYSVVYVLLYLLHHSYEQRCLLLR